MAPSYLACIEVQTRSCSSSIALRHWDEHSVDDCCGSDNVQSRVHKNSGGAVHATVTRRKPGMGLPSFNVRTRASCARRCADIDAYSFAILCARTPPHRDNSSTARSQTIHPKQLVRRNPQFFISLSFQRKSCALSFMLSKIYCCYYC